MRRFLFLTSALVLAACGGGSGGGGGSRDDLTGFRSSSQARKSNQVITSMKSEVLVGEGGTIARSAAVDRHGLSYTSYMLDEVDFKLAQSVSGDPGDAAVFNFTLDPNGRIDTAYASVGGKTLEMVRDGNTKYFSGAVFEYVKDGQTLKRIADDGEITYDELDDIAADLGGGGRWDRMYQRWEVVTSGKNAGLSYSDFGFLNTANIVKDKDIQNADDLADARDGSRTGVNHQTYSEDQIREQLNSPDYFMFAGGYEINSAPDNNMTFKGTAHGKVYSSIQADHSKTSYTGQYDFTSEEDGDAALAFSTNNAQLTYTAGETPTETLVMPFGTDGAAFYDVTVTKTDETVNFAFDPGDGHDDDTYIAKKFRKEDVEDAGTRKVANMGYYGVNSAQEAAGAVGYYAKTTLEDITLDGQDDNAKHEFQFEAAYGMQRQ